jgi:hypothetical protein
LLRAGHANEIVRRRGGMFNHGGRRGRRGKSRSRS